MKKQTLIFRLFSSYLILAVAAIALTLIFGSSAIEKFYFERSVGNLEARSALLSEIIQRSASLAPTELDSLSKSIGGEINTRITLIAPDGQVLADSEEDPRRMDRHNDRPEIIDALQNGTGINRRSSYTLAEEHLYYARLSKWGDADIVVRVSYPTADLDAALDRIKSSFIVSGLVIVVLIALLNWWLSRQVIKPIKVMETGAKRFARGKLKMRIPRSSIAELGNLADSLNQMADEIFDRIRTITQQKNEQIAILSSMTEGVIAVDQESRLLSLNRAAENMFDIRSRNVVGRHIYEVIRHAELIELVNRSLEKKGNHESRIEVFEPTQRLLSAVGSKMPTKKGAPGGAVIVFTDLTHIQRLEAVRREFVANVSHELKTPITSIQGYVETLQDGALKEPETAEKFLNIIAKHSLRLGQIVDDLLELSRIEEITDGSDTDFPVCKISTLLEACATQHATAAETKDIKIIQEIQDDLERPMDLKLMTHAVGNLVDNAIKYSDKGQQITLRSYLDHGKAVIEVADQGSGIEAEHLDRIFERFYRVDRGRSRDVGGTGLGLSIVKHIARIHGIEVKVKSEPGRGTTFKLVFAS